MVPDSETARGGAANRRRLAYIATIAVIFILCTAIVGHDLLRTWEDRSRQIENIRREVTNLALAADQHAQDVFQLADSSLEDIVERVETDGTEPAQLERLRRLLVKQQASSPVVLNPGILDETGDLIANAGPVTTPRVNFADRPYFQYHKTHRDRGLYVSGAFRSKLVDKWVIVVTRRVNHPNGEFAGVVAAAIEVTFFQIFYATLDLGRDGSAALAMDDGTVLVRRPSIDPAAAPNARNIALFRDLYSRTSGDSENVSPLDGVDRIYAWRRVAGYPLMVTAALGKDEQLASWRTGVGAHLLAAGAAALLLGFIGVRLVMQVRRMTRAEQATAAATEAARTAAAQYQLIADNASDMVVTVDMQFVSRYVSPGCRDLVGYEPEELTGGSFVALFDPDDAEAVVASLRAMAAGRDHDLITHRVCHRDGHWIWVEASLRLIRDPESGAPLEICGALRDITQRIAAESSLRDRDRELERSDADLREAKALNIASQYARSLLEASLDPMVTISPDGKITDLNEATTNATGVSRDNMTGTDFSDYFTEPERAREAYRQAFAKGSVRDYALTIRHQDESPVEVLYNASVYKDSDGDVLGVFAAARDMTAQLRAETEVAVRRAEEHERLEELERFQRLTVNRELRMIELKKEIVDLKKMRDAASAK